MNDSILGALIIPLTIFVVVIVAIFQFSIGAERRRCEAFGQISGRQTQFVRYTAMSYDCLTEAKDGKLISTTLLREVAD